MSFSNDALLDYRARRPIVTFDQDHLTDYRPQRLELSLVRDALDEGLLGDPGLAELPGRFLLAVTSPGGPVLAEPWDVAIVASPRS